MIVFDIETVLTDDKSVIEGFRADLIAEIEAAKLAVKAPANYKDQEKIDAYIADKMKELDAGLDAAVEAKVAKTGLDGLHGRIACISWMRSGTVIFSTETHHSEREAIESFYGDIDKFCCDGEEFCGHNIAGFDLPFLKHRSIILGIKPPKPLLAAMNAKPWDKCIADTMLMWSPEREKRVSLKKLCKAFGIESDDGIDGSMVAETWKTDPEKVIYHCKEDVRKVREVYNRITFKG